jgi:hypothetical protein
MARSGSENRQRQITLKARFNEQEAALVKAQADAAGVPVAGLIRYALLDQAPIRATRTPPLDRQSAARILAVLGPLAFYLKEAHAQGNHEHLNELIIAAQRDLVEMRTVLLSSLGREP